MKVADDHSQKPETAKVVTSTGSSNTKRSQAALLLGAVKRKRYAIMS